MQKPLSPLRPDRKKLLREQDHLTRPPRLEGVVKEAKMQPIKKTSRMNNGQ